MEEKKSEVIPFIFRLPKAWFIAFISDWLPIEEIAILDTTVTNHENREHLQSCLRQLNPKITWHVNNFSLQWLSLRQVPVFSIVFNCDMKKIQHLSNVYLPLLVSLEVDFQRTDNTEEPPFTFPPSPPPPRKDIDEAILYLVRNSQEIQCIKLHAFCNVTDAGVWHVADFCPLLHDFCLCPDKNVNVNVTTLVHLFRRCSLLKNVSLGGLLSRGGLLQGYSGTDLNQLNEFGHLFKSLSVFNNPERDNINAKDIISLLSLCPNLTELDYNSDHSDDNSLMLQRLGAICPLITSFHYHTEKETENESIPISIFVNAFRRCSHLREISLGDVVTQPFTDSDFQCLEEFAPLIRSLGLVNMTCSDQGFSSFIGHCHELLSLSAYDVDDEDAAILTRLGENCPMLNNIMLADCTNVNEDSLVSLIQGCPRLDDIDISCKSIVNMSSDAIFETLRFNPTLKRVKLCFQGGMWNEMTVATCFSHCHELEEFSVSWGKSTGFWGHFDNSSLLDTGLAVLAKGCPKLRKISLCSSPLLTINGLLRLCETCFKLTQLNIQGLGKIKSDNLYPYKDNMEIQKRYPAIKMTVCYWKITEDQNGATILYSTDIETIMDQAASAFAVAQSNIIESSQTS